MKCILHCFRSPTPHAVVILLVNKTFVVSLLSINIFIGRLALKLVSITIAMDLRTVFAVFLCTIAFAIVLLRPKANAEADALALPLAQPNAAAQPVAWPDEPEDKNKTKEGDNKHKRKGWKKRKPFHIIKGRGDKGNTTTVTPSTEK